MLIREMADADVETVVRMVHDLAAYEKSSDECRMTVPQLRGALFRDGAALFGHVAEIDGRGPASRRPLPLESGLRRGPVAGRGVRRAVGACFRGARPEPGPLSRRSSPAGSG
jgi:hypothetical protein